MSIAEEPVLKSINLEKKRIIFRLMQLLLTSKIDIPTLPIKHKNKKISLAEKQHLGLILGQLKKLFGEPISNKLKNRNHHARKKSNNESQELKQLAGEIDHLLPEDVRNTFNSFEENQTVDALKKQLKPIFISTLSLVSEDTKLKILNNLEIIADLIANQYYAANISLVWECVNEVDLKESPQIDKNQAACTEIITTNKVESDALIKEKTNEVLNAYQQELKEEIKTEWPYENGIKEAKNGNLFLISRKGNIIDLEKMSKNLRTLMEKYQAINIAKDILNDDEKSIKIFRRHFNDKTRPIIEQERNEIDNIFLNTLYKLFMHPMKFFSKPLIEKGVVAVEKVNRTLNNFQR